MKKKRTVAFWVAVLFLLNLCFSGAAMALPQHAKAASKPEVSVTVSIQFKDEDSARWALKHICKLKTQNVVQGYPDQGFQPNKPVTHAEAVMMTLKALGFEDELKSTVAGAVYLPFNDAAAIPDWVKNAVALAKAKNFLDEQAGGNFQPNKPATRLWVTKLLVKALGLENEAASMQNAELPFKDAASIPAGGTGYVAAAIENGIISGFPDGTFRPFKPVTRAEMTVLLGKADEEMEMPNVLKRMVKGIIIAVNDGSTVSDTVYGPGERSITIAVRKGTFWKNEKLAGVRKITLPVAEKALIYVNDKLATLSDVKAGNRVKAVVTDKGAVIFMEVEPLVFFGRVAGVDSVNNTVTLTRQGISAEFKVADNALISLNFRPAALSDLKVGDIARVKLAGKEIVVLRAFRLAKIDNNRKADEQPKMDEKPTNITGSLLAVTDQTVQVETEEGLSVTYNVTTDAEITLNGSAASLTNLQTGDSVKLTVKGGNAIKIEAETPTPAETA